MPSLGQTTDELVIVEWYKHEGDSVVLGELLLSVQTDKAQVDVESVATGTLLRVLRDAGETVRSGSAVAYIGAPGEVVPVSNDDIDSGGSSASGAIAAVSTTESSATDPYRSALDAPGRVAALPAARRLASELGVDLTTIGGTGPNGVITVRDVEQAAREMSALASNTDGEAT